MADYGIYRVLGVWSQHLNAVDLALASLIAIAGHLGFRRWGWPRIKGMALGVASFCQGLRAISQLPHMLPAISHLQSIEQTLGTIRKEVLPNGGGSLRDAVNMTRDTAQRTEQALAIFINASRAQWDGMGMFGVIERDGHGNVTYANNTLQKWLNRSERDMLGGGWINAIAHADRERVRDEWESCIADVREFSMSYHMVRADGTEFPVSVVSTPVLEIASRGIAKWVGVIRREQGN